jgi:pimeloyl-ACP methyl ester carboxylesterase
MDFEHGYARVNGVRFHYVRAGRGERLVLLLHGFPELWWSWRHQIGPLSERFTVVAPDLRGYNETEKPAWGYEQDVLVHDVAGLITALGFGRAVVAGHDWGGQLAWALAITRPWRVERLVALNAPHPAAFAEGLRTSRRQRLRSWYMGLFLLPWLPEIALRSGNYAFIPRRFGADTGHDATFGAEDLRIYRQALARPGALRAALAYYRQTGRYGTRGMFRGSGMRVSAPTLMIWGEEDAYLGVELVAGAARFVPDLRLRIVPGCSHWVQQQCAARVNEEILDFLGDL